MSKTQNPSVFTNISVAVDLSVSTHTLRSNLGIHTLYKPASGLKGVLEVRVHIHPIFIKIHPSVFLNLYLKIPFLKSGCSEIPVRMT